MRPAERQLLADQCARIQRLALTEDVIEAVAEGAFGVMGELLDRRARPTVSDPQGSTSCGVLGKLANGERAP
jgi:hypothetical protein